MPTHAHARALQVAARWLCCCIRSTSVGKRNACIGLLAKLLSRIKAATSACYTRCVSVQAGSCTHTRVTGHESWPMTHAQHLWELCVRICTCLCEYVCDSVFVHCDCTGLQAGGGHPDLGHVPQYSWLPVCVCACGCAGLQGGRCKHWRQSCRLQPCAPSCRPARWQMWRAALQLGTQVGWATSQLGTIAGPHRALARRQAGLFE